MSEQCKACGQSWWVADPVTGECPGCRIAALEAERDRLREALEQVKRRSQEWRARDKSHRCRYRELLEGVNATARAALEEGGDDD